LWIGLFADVSLQMDFCLLEFVVARSMDFDGPVRVVPVQLWRVQWILMA
jgi:hypothetical protein